MLHGSQMNYMSFSNKFARNLQSNALHSQWSRNIATVFTLEKNIRRKINNPPKIYIVTFAIKLLNIKDIYGTIETQYIMAIFNQVKSMDKESK